MNKLPVQMLIKEFFLFRMKRHKETKQFVVVKTHLIISKKKKFSPRKRTN